MNDDVSTFGERLKIALRVRRCSQQELGETLGVTQSAISQYLSNKKTPRTETFLALAKILRCEVSWLMNGTGEPPTPSVEDLPMRPAEWGMREAPRDGAKDLGNAAMFVYEPNMRTIVRELTQNALDQILAGESGRLKFQLRTLSGAYLRRFLQACGWDDLRQHIEACANQDNRLGLSLRSGLQSVDADQITVLVVADSGTTGLVGREFGADDLDQQINECFAALVRDTQNSQKQFLASGGSYGLGAKSALAASSLKLVIFNSNLSQPTDNGEQYGRLIARTDLGWHRLPSGQDYAGPGWFGICDPAVEGRVTSIWRDDRRAHDLFISRDPVDFGTSVLIAGFHDPSDEEKTVPEIAAEIQQVLSEYFWPAIEYGKIQATVEVYDNEALKSSEEVDCGKPQAHLVSMLRAYHEGKTSDKFTDVTDIVRKDVVLQVPKRKDGRVLQSEHRAVLLVKQLSEADEDAAVLSKNHVAMFRSPGMVVDYRPFTSLGVGVPMYSGVLIAGAAADSGVSGTAAELFLSAAEPPAHDKWTADSITLAQNYRGGAGALQRFYTNIRDALRDALKTYVRRSSNGPESILRHFVVRVAGPGPVTPPPPPPKSVKVHKLRWDDYDGERVVSVTVRTPLRSRARQIITPTLLCKLEDGAAVRINSAALYAVENCHAVGSEISIEPNVRSATFAIRPDWRLAAVDESYAVLAVDLTKQLEGGAA